MARNRKLGIAMGLAVPALAVLVMGPRAAIAAGDTDDSLSPANTAVTSTNTTNITFKGTINFLPITVTCTSSTMKFTTPASGLGPVNLTTSPTYSGCTDTLGGTDTVTTSGTWTITYVDAANDSTASEPQTSGDSLNIVMPKDGATFTSTAVSSCVVTASPNGTTTISATYNESTGVATITNASIPTSGSGCTSSSSTMNGSYGANPIVQDTTT
jgi:hypothetical protein